MPLRPLALALCALLLSACDSGTTSRSIAETDAQGNVLNDDPDDWQPRCAAEPEAFCANPIYPNPVPASGSVTLEFNNPVAQNVEVRVNEGRFVSRRFEAGPQTLAIPVSGFSLGFVQVEIDPADQGRQIEGDLRVVEG